MELRLDRCGRSLLTPPSLSAAWLPESLYIITDHQRLSGKCGSGASTGCPRRRAHPNETALLILQKPHGFLFPKTHFGAFKDDKSSLRDSSASSQRSFFTPYNIHNASTLDLREVLVQASE